jgi:hypothetical protein
MYNRIGPDEREEDQYCFKRVLEHGRSWEAAFKRDWNDSKISLRGVGRRTGLDNRNSLKKKAAELGLVWPRKGPSNSKEPQNYIERFTSKSAVKQSFQDKGKEYRREWLLVLKNNPSLSRTELWKKYYRPYNWLRKHNRHWLMSHMPPSRRRSGRLHEVDWAARDVEFADSVRATTKYLLDLQGKPVRITKNLVMRRTRQGAIIAHNLHRLPKTRRVMKKAVETRIQFAVRRVRWATKWFQKENVTPSRRTLLLCAGIASDIWETPSVKAITDAMMRFLTVIKTNTNLQ